MCERCTPDARSAARDEDSRRWALVAALQRTSSLATLPTAAAEVERAAAYLDFVRPDLTRATTPRAEAEVAALRARSQPIPPVDGVTLTGDGVTTPLVIEFTVPPRTAVT